ncbi:YciI family protein [Nodosilinea nodulosa]|uniref:YciI family protein n=1 Tax=Nodosilinea nodulosa TaxID=416001 RepID=UPI0002E4EE3E|nr:YciI family protein [Nodosilinea nodulosa]
MQFAIQCVLASDVEAQRLSLRPTHLRYLEAHKNQIYCGGPTVGLDGQPEMMLIILTAPDRAAAEAFIDAEPYNRAGVFAQVSLREWRRVLPESEPGELLKEIERS